MGHAHRACHGRQKVFVVQVEACVEAVEMQKPATNFAGDICRDRQFDSICIRKLK